MQHDGMLQAPQRGRSALVPGQSHAQQAAHSCAQQGAMPPLLRGAAAQGLRQGAGRALPCVNAAPALRKAAPAHSSALPWGVFAALYQPVPRQPASS